MTMIGFKETIGSWVTYFTFGIIVASFFLISLTHLAKIDKCCVLADCLIFLIKLKNNLVDLFLLGYVAGNVIMTST